MRAVLKKKDPSVHCLAFREYTIHNGLSETRAEILPFATAFLAFLTFFDYVYQCQITYRRRRLCLILR